MIISTIIFCILLLILTSKIIFNEKQGIILYVIFSLISPNLKIDDIQISFEILAFFVVIPVLLLKNKAIFSFYKNFRYKQCLWLFLFIYILSSLVAAAVYNSSINWISILAILRIIFIIYMLQYIYNEDAETVLDRIISPVLFINFIISIIQLTVPDSTTIFYELYFKNSLTPLEEVLELGYFNRAYGTFGTPVLLGVYNLFCFAIYIGYYIEKRTCTFLNLKIITSLMCGLLALSKTVILGIPVLLISCYLLIVFRIVKVRNNKKVFLIPLIVIIFFIVTVQLLDQHGTAIYWYTDYLTRPIDAFNSRYSDSGILAGTYALIKENILIGVGPTIIGDVFIGDSMYVSIIYSTGVIGVILYFGILISATLRVLVKRKPIAIFCTIAIYLAGLAAPIHFHIVSVTLLAYIFHIAEIKQ